MEGKAWIAMLQSIGWSAAGTGFTFLMTTLGAAMVFLISGEEKPRFGYMLQQDHLFEWYDIWKNICS